MHRIYLNHIHAYADDGHTVERPPIAFTGQEGACGLEHDVWLPDPLPGGTTVPSLDELPERLCRIVCLGLWGGVPVGRATHARETESEALLTFDSLVGPTLLWTEAVSVQFPELMFEHHFHSHDTPECGLVAFQAGVLLGQVRLPESAVRLQSLAEASSDPHRYDEEIDDLVQELMDWPAEALRCT